MKRLYFLKKLFLVVLFTMPALLAAENSTAQTTLTAGDIAFVGFNSTINTANGTTSNRDITFILLKNISSGTVIYLTDYGWRSDAQAFQTARPCGGGSSGLGSGAVTDGIIKWTSTSALSYGTVINVRCRYAPLSANIGTVDPVEQTYNSSTNGSNPAEYVTMGVSESIFAYQGTFASPVLIAGTCFNSTGWATTLLNCDYTPTPSTLPSDLSTGNTAFALMPTGGSTDMRYNFSNTLTGNPVTDRAKIATPSNWQYATASPYILSVSNPSVSTVVANSITLNSAIVGGNVVSDGGATVTERGIVYSSVNSTPTTSDSKIQNGTGTGSYSQTLAGLNSLTTYYYRAYAQNSSGLSYGTTESFTTLPACTAPTITGNPPNRSLCPGSNTTFSISATGATAYKWQVDQTGSGTYTDLSNSAPYSGVTTTTLTITGATTGMNGYRYRAVAIDAGCSTNTNYGTLSISNITASSAQTNVSCFGGSNGTATVTPSGGIGSYTYSWSPSGGSGPTASGLAAGGYTVTITDAIGCTTTRNFTITQPAVLTASSIVTNIACNGSSNGAINLTPIGGSPGYTFSWNDGATTEDRTGLPAGNYSVTITDANSCSRIITLTVSQPPVLVVTPSSQTNVSCNGGSNGAASINVPTGGAGGYTYNWTPGNPTGDGTRSVTGLTAGTWTVTVTDAYGCTKAQSFTITEPSPISVTAASQTNISCYGGSNGSASINVPTGGAGAYTYSWSPGTPTGNGTTSVTGLTAGTYTVLVRDINGCTTSLSFNITQPSAPVGGSTVVTNVACNGSNTGAINLTPTGGVGGYTYDWGGGITTEDRTGLAAGPYTVIITDANGCTGTVNVTVTQPTVISVTPAAQTNVSCNGGSNGAASINVPTGGAGGYTYDWTPGTPTGDGTRSVTGLTAGTWTVTVTDANGCTKAQSFTITQPPAISVTAASQTNISCYGGSNGAASINVPTGGAGGYTYDWTPGTPNGDGTTSVTGLTAGTYTVTVTDANGCTKAQSFTITQPSAPVGGSTVVTNVACNGSNTGAINLTPTGGVGGYTYDWGGGITTEDRTGLAAGPYTVIITDANGCTGTVNVTVTQPAVISVTPSAQTNVSCNGGSNGAASINVPTGGAGGYTYDWTPGTPTGDGTRSVTGLTAGTWTVTVTDANGCTKTQSFTITEPPVLIASAGAQTDVTCNGSLTGSATVNVTGGTGAYTYAWSPSGGTAATANGLAAGTYTVTVRDANLCQTTQSFVITQPSAISVTTSQTNVSCNGGSNGSATVNVSGGTGAYTYLWSPGGSTAATANGLAAGTYTVTIKDANNCTTSRSFTITEPPALVASAASQTNVSCHGLSTGSATVSVTGGTGAYTYSWLPSGGTAATANGLAAGTYTVTVTDVNLCSTTQTFIITEPAAVTLSPASLPSATVAVPYSVNFTPAGGSGSYHYIVPSGIIPPGLLFSSGSLGGTPTLTGTYSFVIRAIENGCSQFVDGHYTIVVGNGGQNITFNTLPAKTYGDADFAAGANSNNPSNPITYTSSNTAVATIVSGNMIHIVGQGSTTITANQASDPNYDAATPQTQTLTVATKPVTVTAATGQSKIYGTVDPVFTYSTNTPLVSGDGFTGALSRVPGNNVGTYALTQGDLSAGANYTITFASNPFNITAKPVTVTANTGQTKVYGNADPTLTYSFSPALISGDAFVGALGRAAGNNVGSYAINMGSLTAGGNYTLSFVPNNFSITAKPITVSPTAGQSKVYGTADPVLTYSPNPALVGGDTFTGTLARATGNNVGAYAINLGSLSAGSNYTLSIAPVNFNITAKPIVVNANAGQTKNYGDADPVFTYTFTPALITGDAFTGSLSRTTGNNVGTYAITQGSFTAGSNYNISFNSANFNITAKPITVTANAGQSKVYGSADPVFTYTSSALVSGDAFTGALSRTAGEHVGTYAIGQGTLTAGSNYAIGYTGANFSITPKALTVTADNKTRVQGTANPAFTATYTGFANGDTNAALLTQPVFATTATPASLQGTYPIVVNGAASNNYTITFVNGTLTVTPGTPTSLTLAAAQLFENKPAGTLAGTLSSTSDDPGATFTYTLVPGTGSTDNAAFSISGNQLVTAQSFDFETKNSYSVRVRTTTQYGLFLEQTFTVNVLDVNEAPTLNTLADAALCTTAATQSIALTGISAGPETAQSTVLSVTSNNAALFNSLSVSGTGSTGTLSYQIKPGASGVATITVTVQDNGGTANGGTDTFTRTFNLTIYALPTPSIASDKGDQVSKGETIKLTATGGTSYVWANANGIISGQNTATLTVRPSVTTTYTVTATNANGCSQSSSFTITVLSDFAKLRITNILSPNGDGFNDKWIIENIDLYPANEAKVFDKAGKLVYSKKGYDNSWDGSFNGSPLSEGTYYYIIDFGPNYGKLKGFVTIVRE